MLVDTLYNFIASNFIWCIPFTQLSPRINMAEQLVLKTEENDDFKDINSGEDLKLRIKTLSSTVTVDTVDTEKERLEEIAEDQEEETNEEEVPVEKRDVPAFFKENEIPVYFIKRG